MKRIIDALLPERLGGAFRWIWLSSTIGNLGDGVLLSAGPLLVVSVTVDPFAVAMAVFVQRLPWLLFGVLAGAIIDRVDRRLLVAIVDLFRAAVLALLATAIAFDSVSLALIYLAMFLLGTAETVADNASSALVAGAVPKVELGQANSRIFGTMMVNNQLVGPPLGAFVFALGTALPFGFNAVCFLLAVALITRIESPPRVDKHEPRSSFTQEIGEGLRWLWSHAAVRTLAIMITAFNVTFGAAFSIMVLYAHERLGLSDFGFGLLMTASACGGLLGATAFPRLERSFSYASILRAGLIVETLTHLGLALTRQPVIAGVVLVAFGLHAVVWGTTSTTVRQRAVPDALLGRVTSVYMIGSIGALALGTFMGGVIAQRWGVVAPFWFAFLGSALVLTLTWRAIGHVAQAADTTLPLGSPTR